MLFSFIRFEGITSQAMHNVNANCNEHHGPVFAGGIWIGV